jgi:hypothetical protein
MEGDVNHTYVLYPTYDIDKTCRKLYIVIMYGEGWTFKGGKGGISSGGGSTGKWIAGDIEEPVETYITDCVEPLPYLGMIYDFVNDEGEITYKVLMKVRKHLYDLSYVRQFDPAELVTADIVDQGYEYEEYTHLPIPDEAFESSEITFVSGYSFAVPYKLITDEFDGAKYWTEYSCYTSEDDIVREHRGQPYLESLEKGYENEGEQQFWEFYKQSVTLEETAFPGPIIVPRGDGPLPGILPGTGPGFGHGTNFGITMPGIGREEENVI